MTWLLVGGDSEIGKATGARATALGIAFAASTRRLREVGPTRPLLDLSSSLSGWKAPVGTEAACIFAAIARLAACEDDPPGSARVNVEGTLTLADQLLARGIHVLFLSTNQVFDGERPFVSADAPLSPRTEYGRQKARAETALVERMAAGAPAAILRLAKVVAPDMKLFRDWIAKLKRGEVITAFADMMLAPTPIGLVANAIITLMQDHARGMFQLTGSTDLSYADAARLIARRIGASEQLVQEASGTTIGLPPTALPKNTTLDSSALRIRYGMTVPEPIEVIEGLIAISERRG